MFNPRLFVAALLIGTAPFSLPGIARGADEETAGSPSPAKPKHSPAPKKSPTPAAAVKKAPGGEAKKSPTPEGAKKSESSASHSKKTAPEEKKAPEPKKSSSPEDQKAKAQKPDSKNSDAKKNEPGEPKNSGAKKAETGKSGSKPDDSSDAPVTKSKKSKAKPKPATKKRHSQPGADTAARRHGEPKDEPKKTEPEKKPEEKSEREKEPQPQKTPEPRPANPSPQPSHAAAEPSRPVRTEGEQSVVVTKSGVDQEEEPAPVPDPAAKPRWWWPFSHSEVHYKYLSPRVREAIDDARVQAHRWRYIVVHNSGTRQGSAKAFDYYHRYVRKMPNGLAYHFVIGNGTSTPNGYIEIGPRWVGQINGGHVHSDYLNSIALGICLVGDYNKDRPTKEQLEALDELIRYLRKRVGKTDHHLAVVKPHRDINPPQWPTDCPGDRFPYEWLHSNFDE